jgi:hypothetical protein
MKPVVLNSINARMVRNHLQIWLFVKFMHVEEKQLQTNIITWSIDKKNPRTIVLQNHINILYEV